MAITKMWKIDKESFPKRSKMEEKIKFLLKYAILAPSLYNTQPWQFKINKNKLTITLDPSRIPKEIDKENLSLNNSER